MFNTVSRVLLEKINSKLVCWLQGVLLYITHLYFVYSTCQDIIPFFQNSFKITYMYHMSYHCCYYSSLAKNFRLLCVSRGSKVRYFVTYYNILAREHRD